MAQTVIGMFDNASEAQQAVEQLVSRGFSRENIDVSSSGNSSTQGYASGNTGTTSSSSYSSETSGSSSTREESGSGIGKFFRSLFGNDEEADTYSNVATRSGSIVTVHAQSGDEAERAADILDDAGAVDVDERAAQYGYSRSNENTSGSTSEGERSIPVIEEELEVGKRMVQTGGKRLRSRIIERPVEESLRLREERVRVERNTVDRPATEADFDNFKETEIEITEQAEVPVVSKQARVVEEVSLGKDVTEHEETVRDTVRKTEVDVEDVSKSDKNRNTETREDWSDKQSNF